MMMNVLLTGGAGYIGSHTAVELLESEYDVIIADDFSNSSTDVINQIKKITGKGLKLYHIDVADKSAMRQVFIENDIGAVIHFAGFKSVNESVEQPLKYYRNNLGTTLTLLEVMCEHNVNKIVFSSSATVYGKPKKLPITEDMPTSAINPYGQTKLMIEQIMQDLVLAETDWSVALLRYFNPVGAHKSGLIGELPNGTPNNLMPYISQVAAGKLDKLHIYGNDYPTIDGTGVRDYIHVVDLAKGHISALKYLIEHKGVSVFNLGTGVPSSVLKMVTIFESVTGQNVPYVIDERRSGDVASCYASADKARQILDWRAEKTLQDMCADTWRWQQHCTEKH